ncbi:carboxypeptidase regulatory-like domain-containing protein [Natronosporangium hydrolyticum]|uniref:alpha-amylase n=1 Tax=Natronosporangium hydrolyticum TaxID=2811111 RepID=A0A895YQ98_9ACTN|nr:carboxypeptidase regulatory-like domain-containing protein [Natronosporangium hydrolyticum]QSB16300.1 carboxypeptidase regulatory-like domain-containing protein [Natronosporangium hydrolyticum]
MFRPNAFRLLVPGAAAALILGLAPAPAAAGPAPATPAAVAPATVGSSPPAADADADADADAITAPTGPVPTTDERRELPPVTGDSADPPTMAAGGERVDVYSGLDGAEPAPEPAPAEGHSGHPDGVAEEVTAAVDAAGRAPVIVRLHDQPDLPAIEQEAAQAGLAAAAATAREQHGARNAGQWARDAERAARGRTVVAALQDFADQHQPAVATLLSEQATAGQVSDVRSFWVFNGFAATVDETALATLADHPDVASVSLDRSIELADPFPADPGEPHQPVWSLESVNAPQVWGDYGVRGEGIVVGVMDSGVDGGHPALADSWRGHRGDPAASWFAPTGENYPTPGDGHGHGTHVTGSIVGAPPGEVTGVAPDAQWIAAKIFTDGGGTTDSIIHAAFEWMLAPGGDPAAAPHVVNNSWGSDATYRTEHWDAVDAWVAAGIVPIFANGNNGPGAGTVGSPASFPNSIGIGATDREDRIAWFSSRGPVVWDGVEHAKPMLSAPGYDIYSAWPTHLPDGPYHTISGTSMAAPHATGVVALLLAAAPQLTIDDVREVLTRTARGESHMTALPHAYGAGVVDAYAAVTEVAHAGAVLGTVTGPDGEPVAATVSSADPGADLSVETDPETGGYALWLPPGDHELTVAGYGYQTWTGPVTITTGETTTVDVSLPVAAEQTLSGTVTGADGPVTGARIALPGTPLEPVRTGTDGGFRLTIAEGEYALWASAAGHEPATVPITVDGDTEVSVPLAATAVAPDPEWALYQNNPARTGVSTENLAAETLQPDWQTSAGGAVTFSSPVIDDGRVFVNADPGQLVALDLDTGEQLWAYDVGAAGLRGAPAVADGVVYTGGGEAGGFHAVDAATGEPVWSFPTPDQRTIYSVPAVADGVVYVNTGFTQDRPDTLYALDAATGDELWSADLGSRAFFGPAVGDGLVIATSAGDRRLVAFDAATGAEVWTLARDADEFVTGPSIADGSVYVTTSVPGGSGQSFQGSLLAVDAATGELRWENTSHGDGQGSVPAVHGDLVIAGSHGLGVVAAYHRDTGAAVWHYGLPTSGGVSSSVLVSGDGYVIGGSQLDQRVFALDAATGELVWEQPAGANVLSSPAYADGRLVTADGNGAVRAFHPTGSVAGTVTGPDGPLPATVSVPEAGLTAEADADGSYRLDGLLPGEYTVVASYFGYTTETTTITVTVAQTTTAEFTLSPVADGALAGTVTDEAGDPLGGAQVTISGTPLPPAVTDEAGGYRFDQVPAGSYPVVVDADGYARTEETVVIAAGETTVADYVLSRYDIAVVADYEGRVAAALTDAGWRVDEVSFATIDGALDHYGAVVLAGMGDDRADADLERFGRIVEQADQAGTSLVFLDTGGPSYGSIRTLSQVTGDPASEAAELSNRGEVWLADPVDHPITASLPATGRAPVLTSGSWHAWFDDYSGYSLAALGNDRDGERGAGVGYQPRTLDSNHVLLPATAASPWSTWQPAMAELLVDAVDHAAQASYGEATGPVTDADGEPVTATVELIGGLAETVTDEHGRWRLLLDPGEHTLRFTALGYEPVERAITVVGGQSHEIEVSLPTAALATLTGQITEDGGGAPVTGATVTLPETGASPVSTDPDGRYLVTDLPGGQYRVEVSADGYEPLTIDEVELVEGAVTELDAALTRAPGVVVLGDRNDEISDFLEGHSIPVEQAGWEVVDDLAGIEVVILHNPSDLGRDDFLAALAAFDAAGVSVIFPADGWATRTRGVDLLVRHTGNPGSFGRLGGVNGPPIFLHDLADHPVFAGVDDDPAQLLNPASEAGYFPAYEGVTLAQVGESDADPAGIGVAYDVRTPDNVHLLLSGLAATLRNTPTGNWTPAGQQIFVDAVRWAADPAQSGLAGTVTDPDGVPIPDAVVEVADSHWQAVTDDAGRFEIGVPPGEHTLHYTAFGYQPAQRTVTVAAGTTVDVSAELELGEVGTIDGVVTSEIDGAPLAGTTVELLGTPHQTVTGPAGEYEFTRVAAGSYELELEIDEHVRTLSPVSVDAGETTRHDVELVSSPLVGIIDDSDFSNSRDRGKEFLADWGYEVEEIGFGSLDRIGELDLVVANVSDFGLSLTDGELRAFEEAVNRAGVPVLWLGQHGRGAIQFLHEHDDDPAVLGEGFNDGPVTAAVAEPHPLVAGLDSEFPLMVDGGRYSFFDEFAGETVAALTTGDHGERGAAVAYRGRTTAAVDVLLATSSITTHGAPGTRTSAALNWTPQAERLLVNALAWALTADQLGAEVRGTVDSDLGGRIASEVQVVETGRTYQGREGDGSFLVPLAPGSWTLQVSAFGHATETVEVTVAAGETRSAPVTLPADPAGGIAGTVTGPDGAPVPDAEVTVLGTPLTGATDDSGDYLVDAVPAGDWTVRITADGYRTAQLPVTVPDGGTVTADVQLAAGATVAVVDTTGSSTHGESLAGLLTAEGYEVELVPRAELPELVDRVDDYQLVIVNASLLAAQQDDFPVLVDAAADAGVSMIHSSQHGGGYAIPQLAAQRGDPASADWGFVSVGVDYVPTVAHPIFAGFEVGEPIELITSTLSNQNQQYGSFEGYGGETIGQLHGRTDGADLGAGVGYQFTSPTSVELLLGGLAASGHGWPDERWTDDARQLYRNAVAWTLDARQAELTGVVTGGGEPLAGATVTSSATGATAVTGTDGGYALGLTTGEHTIEVEAFGYATVEEQVEIPESGTVTLDVDLTPLPRSTVSGTVSATTGEPVAGAEVSGAGPTNWSTTTGADGGYIAADLLPGEYQVSVRADGFQSATATVTVTADEPAQLDITLQPTDIGVLGDAGGALTGYLQEAGVPAAELTWDAGLDLTPYQVVVVNGGNPDGETFTAVLDAADEAEVSLIFTGTWGVDRGGVRLLERHTDRVTVGAQGYGDGPVQLTGFDPEHPAFARLGDDPATLIVEGGYYSVLAEYVGEPLAELTVARDGDDPVTGPAVGWDRRTAGSVEVLLSASAVTEAVGPGLGWTDEAGRLLVDTIDWARDQALAPPEAPSLTVEAPLVVTETVEAGGEAAPGSTVTVLASGEPVASTEADVDGAWSVAVPLPVGQTELTAVASNPAGESPPSEPVTVSRWQAEWEVRGGGGNHPVTLTLTGPPVRPAPAELAELVVRDGDGEEVARVQPAWAGGFYLGVIRDLPPGEYTLSAELLVDGHLLVIDGPPVG